MYSPLTFQRVNGQVRLRLYKGNAYVLGRSSQSEKLYSAEEASMDSLEDFEPTDTTGFVAIQSIRYAFPAVVPQDRR